MNQQIQSLRIDAKDVSLLQPIIIANMQMQLLKYLHYKGLSNGFGKFDEDPIHFPNVEKFEFTLRHPWGGEILPFQRIPFPRIPFSFNNLKELIIAETTYNFRCLERYFDFIQQNKFIEKIKFHDEPGVKIVPYAHILKTGLLSKSKLKEALPSLKEICLQRYPNNLCINDVICYLTDFQSLNYFSFNCLN